MFNTQPTSAVISLDATVNTPQIEHLSPVPLQPKEGENATLINLAFMFPNEQLNTAKKKKKKKKKKSSDTHIRQARQSEKYENKKSVMALYN